MYVSNTEPAIFHGLGELSTIPEVYGVDFLWAGRNGLAGVQRKTVWDLIQSVEDGRLQRELLQMQRLTWPGLVIEGELKLTPEGVLVERPGWSLQQILGIVWSCQEQGIFCWFTRRPEETILSIRWYEAWTKREHKSLRVRPKITTAWGTREAEDWAAYVLQAFPGIGPQTARAIVERFGLPLCWTVTEKQLRQVPGIGPKRARELIRALEGGQSGDRLPEAGRGSNRPTGKADAGRGVDEAAKSST